MIRPVPGPIQPPLRWVSELEICLLTAIELTHLHTHNTKNNTINLGRVRAVPRLCELYLGICFTTEEKARENLSQGSRRVPVGTMKTESV